MAPHIIGEAPADEDEKRNTDLTVIKAEPVRIACRVRRPNGYAPHEFTLRCGRPNGAKTELQKLLEGWGDYFFYAHADRTERRLRTWTLYDLRVFRLWMQRYPYAHNGRAPGVERWCRDGSSRFRIFDARQLPRDFVVARYGVLERVE